METTSATRFPLGHVVTTLGVLENVAQDEINLVLERHSRGDWGEMCAEDVRENESGLAHSLRLLSAYTSSAGIQIWIITEADRSATTVLLPEEY